MQRNSLVLLKDSFDVSPLLINFRKHLNVFKRNISSYFIPYSQSTYDGKIIDSPSISGKKVSVIGVGQTGMATAFSILSQNTTNEIALVDVNKTKLQGEFLDLVHGSMFFNSAKIEASSDFAVTANSRLSIICAGINQKPGESRLNLLERNLKIFKEIIPQIVRHSPDTILLIVTNPVDVLTYFSWKLSGLPKNRVIGSGTNLDTSRFRYYITRKMGISAINCHGWIIGEHGDSSVAVWSGVNVAGVPLRSLFLANPEKWKCVHRSVVNSAGDVIALKGYTSWALGLSCASIANSILKDSGSVHAVSVHVKGLYGISDDVFLSLPSVLGNNGVSHTVELLLLESELKAFKKSSEAMGKIIKSVMQ